MHVGDNTNEASRDFRFLSHDNHRGSGFLVFAVCQYKVVLNYNVLEVRFSPAATEKRSIPLRLLCLGFMHSYQKLKG